MTRRRLVLLALLALVAAAIGYSALSTRATALVLTGIVTTNDVIVSPQIARRVGRLLVAEGDVVKSGQLLAVIEPDELRADSAYYDQTAAGLAAQVEESQAARCTRRRRSPAGCARSPRWIRSPMPCTRPGACC
jgi:multidrug efflux pump subunit AcrA (membrane-fusion protein)